MLQMNKKYLTAFAALEKGAAEPRRRHGVIHTILSCCPIDHSSTVIVITPLEGTLISRAIYYLVGLPAASPAFDDQTESAAR